MIVTKAGTVESVKTTGSGSSKIYSAKVMYPEPPPAEIVEHKPIDKDYYDDLRAALTGDKPVTVSYDDASPDAPVTGVTIKK